MVVTAFVLIVGGFVALKVVSVRNRKAKYAAISDPVARDRARFNDDMAAYQRRLQAWQWEQTVASSAGINNPALRVPPKPPRMPPSLMNG